MTSPDRIRCIVPFCRRTAPVEMGDEIICGKCWRRIPLKIRARRTAITRRARKVERLLMRRELRQHSDIDTQLTIMARLFDRLWARNWEELKAAAIEAAGGIA